MKTRMLVAAAVFVVGFGVGLGVTYALLSRQAPAAPGGRAADDPGAADDGTEPPEVASAKAPAAARKTDGTAPDEVAPDGAPKTSPSPSAKDEGPGGDAKPAAPPNGAPGTPPGDDPPGGEGAKGTPAPKPDDGKGHAPEADPKPAGDPAQPKADGADPAAAPDKPGTDDPKPAAAPDKPKAADAPPAAEPAGPKGWWQGLAGKRCRVDLGNAAALRMRSGELEDGQVVDWKRNFGSNQAIGSLAKVDDNVVLVHGVGVDESGTPIAAKVTIDRGGRKTTGIIALHTQGLKVTLRPLN